MNGNYIGNNPNGSDFILSDNYQTNNPKLIASTACVNDAINQNKLIVDNKTTIEKDKKIVSKDIAINGDDTDLARNRGQIGDCYDILSGIDFNTLFKAGRYWFTNAIFAECSNKPPVNVGGFCDVLGEESGNSYTKQIYHVYNSPVIYIREHKGTNSGWSETWTKIITEKNLATSSTPGIVQLNNTTSSTSTSQAATANAVKLAYDKAVEAYTKAESAQGSSASADKLTTARTIQTNLASTASASFDGTANVTPGVTGVLPVANGGTGRTDGKALSLVTKRTIDGVQFDGSAGVSHYATCSTEAATADKVVSLSNFTLTTGAQVAVRFTVTNTASSPTLNVNETGAKPIQYRNAAIAAGYLAANRTYLFVYNGSSYELVGDVNTDTKYTAATATPQAPGTAVVGTSSKYAREDHVHPLQTTVSGNSGTTTKLATKRTIDGVSFDGSANITHFGVCSTEAATAAKTVSVTGFTLATGAELTVQFTVTNTAASPTLNVNSTGAKAIVYRNAAISAGYLAANRVYKFVYDGTNYELIGDINTDANTKVTQTVTTTDAEYPLLVSTDANKTATSTTTARFASGVTLNPSTKKISCSGISGEIASTSYVNSAKDGGSLIDIPGLTAGGYQPIFKTKSTNGAFVMSGYQAYLGMHYITDENIEAGTNTVTESLKFDEDGLLTSTGGFKGALNGNASSSTKLATARTIDGVSFNGTANITHYGTCSTEAATADKVVSVTSFTLATGAVVYVRFTVTNTASSPTLNVNSTGAKAIRYRNAAISAGYLAANRTYCFIYDGSYYQLVGDVDTNTKYTAASATPKDLGTAAVGTSTKYAREDHVHNLPSSIGGSIPIGGIIAFSGTFGGTNNRFPIPLGSTTADTNWCLCDGTTTNGKTVPDLRGRMILGASSTYAAGSTGGSATHTHSISGTVGETTLTVEQMPSHVHSGVERSGGPNTHHSAEGAERYTANSNTNAAGGSQPHTHTLSGESGSANSLPPYYALSYIMRLS